MSSANISIISTIVNLLLAAGKLGVGLVIGSAALIADGIHSGLDIISSFVAFLGIKKAKKPADPKHPYGHLRYETAASFLVTFLLALSGVWIIYEGINGLVSGQGQKIGFSALIVVAVSIIVNEIMARLKFRIGRKGESLALIADAEHSRADALSSVAVLIGLFLARFFTWADSATAILVGLFILYETYDLSRHVMDDLLDIANPEIEQKIKQICQREEINLLSLKTRKIGAQNFGELKIGLNPEWKVTRVNEVVRNLESILRQEIPNLKMVTIEVTSHEFKTGYLKSRSGKISRFKEETKAPYLKKLGQERTVISVKNNQFHYDFGAPEYLVIDRDARGKILQKEFIKNPYYVTGRGHGMRFMRALQPDKIVTAEIGKNAQEKLEQQNVKIELINKETNIEDLI